MGRKNHRRRYREKILKKDEKTQMELNKVKEAEVMVPEILTPGQKIASFVIPQQAGMVILTSDEKEEILQNFDSKVSNAKRRHKKYTKEVDGIKQKFQHDHYDKELERIVKDRQKRKQTKRMVRVVKRRDVTDVRQWTYAEMLAAAACNVKK